MAAEPPTKRMRLSYPDPEPDSDNDQDGDELVFQPEEVCERRDPDNRLARKRIKAGNRFQQAMSGIFSKYARDFSHVGDEIDLETGEVVVDNGHLRNLQFEGDVGVDDDDEGMLLGDLESDGEDMRLDWEDESEEEERIMHGQAAPMATANPLLELVRASDPHMKPWDVVDDARAIERPAPPPQKPRQADDTTPAWAAYSGANSIWAPEDDYHDDWAPLARSRFGTLGDLRKTIAGSRLSLPAPDASSAAIQMEVDNSLGAELVNRTNEDDDLMEAQATLSLSDAPAPAKVMIMRTMRGPDKDKPTQALPKTKTPRLKPKPAKKSPAKNFSPKPTPFNQLVIRRPIETPPPDPNCRRSGRSRTQTEFMGKISWTQALSKDHAKGSWSQDSREANNIVVEIQSPSFRREEYEAVDDSANESIDEHGLPTPPESADEDVISRMNRRTIPDSQETRESVKSSPRTAKAQQEVVEDMTDLSIRYAFGNPSHDLSDDELPVVFARRSKPATKAAVASKSAFEPLSALIDLPVDEEHDQEMLEQTEADGRILYTSIAGPAPAPAMPLDISVDDDPDQEVPQQPLTLETELSSSFSKTLDIADTEKVREERALESLQPEEQLQPRGRGRPRKSNPAQNTAVPMAAEAPVEAAQPKRQGRPRKSLQPASHEQPAQDPPTSMPVDIPVIEAQPKRRGRPRKSPQPAMDEQTPREVPDSQEDAVEAKEPIATINEEQPTKRGLGRPKSRGNNEALESVLKDPVDEPRQSPDYEPMVIDLPMSPEPVAPEATQHLSSNHTIADSASEPTSSALQARLQATPSRRASPAKATPLKTTKTSPKPSTPRHTALRTSKTPTSRCSILSLVSDDDDDDESDNDVLLRSDDLPRLFDSPSAKRHANKLESARKRTWKSTPLTTEIFRTPVKRKRRRGDEEGDTVNTPGGSTRTCGVDGYRCGRDFCFNCL